jgi:hypothetical protein
MAFELVIAVTQAVITILSAVLLSLRFKAFGNNPYRIGYRGFCRREV